MPRGYALPPRYAMLDVTRLRAAAYAMIFDAAYAAVSCPRQMPLLPPPLMPVHRAADAATTPR